ncbi:MAG: hypothetical protein MMC33_008299 [Icmadophila ericetorum]|nr:hypothetical protein [Icmadophila ericetorum]
MLSTLRTSILLGSLLVAALFSTVSAHTVITYPGWRGDNLHTNGTDENFVDSGGLGMGPNNSFPYGMQWMYPCGGMPLTQNRTKWPVKGGAVALQPGWFQGHSVAFIYINLGEGTLPINMSLNMVPVFQVVGPTNQAYPGSICLPQVPLPANYQANIGDNATIQVVEAAQHGAALFSCVDITFADPSEVEPVTADNCQNSSDIGFNLVFATTSLTGVGSLTQPSSLMVWIPLTAALLFGLFY